MIPAAIPLLNEALTKLGQAIALLSASETPAPLPQSLDINAVRARVPGICTRTISRLIKRGFLKRVPGVRRVLVTEESLSKYLGGGAQ